MLRPLPRSRPAGRALRRLALALALGAAVPGGAAAFCFDQATDRYKLPPLLLQTIAELESGLNPEAANWNRDGSVDVGLMQINSWWEPRLGPSRWIAVCTDPCYNVQVGAWILADCLHRHGYTLQGLGCYNARSPDKRKRYSEKVLQAVMNKLGAPQDAR
ncbi:MAG: lytic transglycosylase domain-containing protein [Deferrisomatales bacterium]